MKDKSLDVLLMILFGIGGITIMVLTWSQIMQLPERLLNTSIGMIGLIWSALRVFSLKSITTELVDQKNETQDSTGNNNAEDRSLKINIIN